MPIVTATIGWTEPDGGGTSITGYDGERKRNQDASWTSFMSNRSPSSARSFAVTGLDNAHRWDFQVRAKNSVGNGAWGQLLNQELIVAPSEVSQTWTISGINRRLATELWWIFDNISREALPTDWALNGATLYWGGLRLRKASARIRIQLETTTDTQNLFGGQELTTDFETRGRVELVLGTHTLSFNMSDLGSVEPYTGGASGTALATLVDAFVDAIFGLSDDQYTALSPKTLKLILPDS